MSHSRSGVIAAVSVALVIGGWVPAGAAPAKQEWRVTTVAGMGGESGYSGDGGPATEARLTSSPAYGLRLAVAENGTLYVAEWANHRLRRVTPDGVIDTVPGTQTRNGNPRGVVIAGDGAVYLATDVDIRKIGADGTTGVLLPESAPLLSDIAVDAAGNIYYANHFFDDADRKKASVVRLDRSGATSTIVEEKTEIYTIAVDAAGTVYYTTGDMRPDSGIVHAVSAGGGRRTAATLPAGNFAGPVTVAPDGTPHVVDVTRGQILGIGAQGGLTPVGPAMTGRIDDLAFRADGTPYVAGGGTVRRLDRFTGDEEKPARATSPWADDEPGSVHHVMGSGRKPGIVAPGLSTPAVGGDGTVYVAEPRRNLVHAISRDGKVTRFAGTGTYPDEENYTPDRKTAGEVRLAAPHAVAVDRGGNVYLATRTAILRIGRDRRVSTVTEVDNLLWHANRPDLLPQLAVGGSGTVFYVESAGPLEGVVRSVTDGGPATTIAGAATDRDGLLPGRYSDNKRATDATLRSPTALSVGADGTVYLIETSSEGGIHGVRAVRPDGLLGTVAGHTDDDRAGNGSFAGDGGPAAKAGLNNPRGVAAGPDGTFYVADTYNERVRRVTSNGVITTVAGTGRRAETGDDGPATAAALLDPSGLAVGADGTVYVTSAESTRVRAIAPDGTISTLADLRTPPTATPSADIDKLAAGPDGTAYVGGPDGLTSVGPDGTTRKVRGLTTQGPIATGPDGSVYQLVPEYTESAKPEEQRAQLWRRYPDGTVLRVAADQPLTGARDLAVGPDGEIYLATATELSRLGDTRPILSTKDKPFESSESAEIHDITVGADGTPYLVHEYQVFAVRKGKPELLAGNGEQYSSDEAETAEDGGQARDATLEGPTGIAATRDGTVFIATAEGLRRVSQGVIETLDAGVDVPRQLALTPSGDLYAATAEQVFAVVQPARVTTDRTSWTWLWFTLGALVVLAAGGALLLRHRRSTSRTEEEAQS